MKIWKTLMILALLCGQAALAEHSFVTLVRAMETSPGDIILPLSASGTVTYRQCAERCDEKYERARLTSDTVFTVAGKTVKYAELKKVHGEIRNDAEKYAFISVDLARLTVTSIDISR